MNRFLAALLFVLAAGRVAAGGWKPLDPGLLGPGPGEVDPGADAEALTWTIRASDEIQGPIVRSRLEHELRIKVLTARGCDLVSQVQIPYRSGTKIRSVAARTVLPEGRELPLDDREVFDRDVVRARGVRVKVRSFVLPGLVPGAIVDYRWTEEREQGLNHYLRIPLDRDIPVRELVVSLKPLVDRFFPYGMRYRAFQVRPVPLEKGSDGYYTARFHHVPAAQAEPLMPPDASARPWLLVYYSRPDELPPARYWPSLGRALEGTGTPWTDKEVQATAAAAVEGATDAEDKARRLLAFCRERVKNALAPDAEPGDLAELAHRPLDTSPLRTLERGSGVPVEIARLMVALARASGLDARLALVPDREHIPFHPDFTDPVALGSAAVAVKVDTTWRFYDPTRRFLPGGMLAATQERQQALIVGADSPGLVPTPSTASIRQSVATFRLDGSGAIEGEVEMTLTGHPAVEARAADAGLAPAEIEVRLREDVRAACAEPVVSSVRSQGQQTLDEPYVITYHLRCEGFAQRTGERLIIQPHVFREATAALSAPARTHPVAFAYPHVDRVRVILELPPGVRPEALAPMVAVDAGTDIQYRGGARLADPTHLEFQRRLVVASPYYPAESYLPLKEVLDRVHEADALAIPLRR